jgi:uncharacterized protein involved in outer membrane biogenesis
MNVKSPSLKTSALILAGLVAIFLLFAWLILPRIIQDQAEKFIAEKSGHHLSMNRPEFNPFSLSLHLSGLHLTQPDNAPLLAFQDLVLDLSAASLYRGEIIFDDIHLDGLEATVVLLPDGKLNWSALLDSLKSKDQSAHSELPKLEIHHFALTGSKLDFSDKKFSPAFATRIEPLDIELTDISTLPNEQGQYQIRARTTFGANVAWHGDASINPLATKGGISVDGADLAKLSPLLKDSLPIAPPAGKAGFSTDYKFSYAAGHMDVNLEHVNTKVTDLVLHGNGKSAPTVGVAAIAVKEGRYNLAKNEFALDALGITGFKLDIQQGNKAKKALELDSLTLERVQINLATHQAALGNVSLKGGGVQLVRDAKGRIDLIDALQAATPPAKAHNNKKPDTEKTAAKPDWRYRVDKVALNDFAASVRDESVAPAAQLVLENIALSLEGVSSDWKIAVPLHASFKARSGGSFAAEGKITPAGPTADIRLKLADLILTPAQPYLSKFVKLKLADGRLSTAGRAVYNAKESSYQGSFALNNLKLAEADSGIAFLLWKSLASSRFKVTPKKIDIGELTLSGLDTQIVINKDKTTNFSRMLMQAPSDAQAKPATTAAAPAHPFAFNIDRFRINKSELDYADYSLILPFATHIHDLKGTIAGLSSHPGEAGQVELDGQVDEYGLARAVGQVDFVNPTDALDVKVAFSNVDMTRLTPYSATFAGRKITSGKLSLNLQYKIHQRQLEGDNQITIDQFTLGERVESPEAKDLPLDLAIAILQDSDGRIDLGLPVSGNLDDPQFSYGGIIWKAIINVFTKIATAPFRALGALFGGGEKFENIVFEAGRAQLTPPEREKLAHLAEALKKRPKLSIAIHGVYAEVDRAALQDRDLRHAVLEKSGQHIEGSGDPGPISTRQPKIQTALETMYAEGFGSDKLAALKNAFRQANPGQQEENSAGKIMSRLSALLQEKRPPDDQEVAQMKGADFYAVLFERLRDKVNVDDARLLALAAARADYAVAALKTEGAPAERIAVDSSERVKTEGQDIPVKLVLGAVAKSAAAVSGVAAH